MTLIKSHVLTFVVEVHNVPSFSFFYNFDRMQSTYEASFSDDLKGIQELQPFQNN